MFGTWCVREGSSVKFRGESGKFLGKGKGGIVGRDSVGGEGYGEGQGKRKREQVCGVWREERKIHAACQQVIMGVEHYHGNASLQDLRVSRLLKVGSDTCVLGVASR